MPTNVVKYKWEEKVWKEAKEIAKKQKPDNIYALTMHIYKKMRDVEMKRRKGVPLRDGSGKGVRANRGRGGCKPPRDRNKRGG